jgi:hypothetical protein
LKERWIDWVSNYNRGRTKKNASASTIYNRVQQPTWILWLAEASGIDKRLIRKATNKVANHDLHQTQAKEMRDILNWTRIARLLEQRVDLADSFRPSPKHLAGYHSPSGPSGKASTRRKPERNSSGAAGDPYSRYVETYEVEITPAHNTLQESFERFLTSDGATELRPNVAGVDLRYQDATKGTILVEIKSASIKIRNGAPLRPLCWVQVIPRRCYRTWARFGSRDQTCRPHSRCF